MADYELRHKELMLPVVRVHGKKGTGSGTIIYSKPAKDEHSTYILTNHHVVDGNIEVKDEWSMLLQRNRKRDVLSSVDVHMFEYKWSARAIGGTAIDADIAAYDKNEDLALLHLRTGREPPAVAKLFPRGEERELRATMPVYAVGAGMGGPPVITMGMLSQFGQEIDNREFWLSTAPTIFGNSGGALFHGESHELLGVPARIVVAGSIFGGSDAITHLSYAIPITRIYNFLEAQRFRFIYDNALTEEGEAKERDRIREQEERRQAAEIERGEAVS